MSANLDDLDDLDELPTYPLADALAAGVPPGVHIFARRAGGLRLTRPDGSHVRFTLMHPNWNRNGGTWYAKGHAGRATFTGYAGGDRPRGGGVPGLSAAGIRRALDGIERQRARHLAGVERTRCVCCGRVRV